MSKHVAIYVRVSTDHQDTALQDTDLRKWLEVNPNGTLVEWYRDKATSKTMDRPGWQKLERALTSRRISAIVVWRLDRLGRTASGLTKLFDTISKEGVNLISLKDSLDLSTPAGRLMANVLASAAQYESEIRGERVRAGIDCAKANGKRWGGSKYGRPAKGNADKAAVVLDLARQGKSISSISRTVGLSRQWIYELIRRDRSMSD